MITPIRPAHTQTEKGFALITVMVLVAVLAALGAAYYAITMSESSSQLSQANLNSGFNAAEGGLNLRAKALRAIFQSGSGNTPQGTPAVNCLSANSADWGTQDYACTTYTLGNRKAVTYLKGDSTTPTSITIPGGELYAGLNAQEYTYDIYSQAGIDPAKPEAILQMRTKVRLVPMFQFAAYYNKDLEIEPGPNMALSGPVHANGDLYLDSGSGSTLAIGGQTSATGNIYQGRKDANNCSGRVTITDASETPTYTPYSSASSSCSGSRKQLAKSDLPTWGGNVQMGVNSVEVPQPADMDPTPGKAYWDKADLRVVLKMDSVANTPIGIEVRKSDGTVDTAASSTLNACTGAVSYSDQTSTPKGMYNYREGKWINMLDVNVPTLLDCMHQHTATLMGGKDISDTTDGGLVLYLTVDGPNKSVANSYGVRLKNGGTLAATDVAAPAIKGLTVVTNQAAYVQGDYNSTNKKPASILADSFNVLSNNWNDANSQNWGQRVATSTTINAAVLAGTDSTANTDGAAGQDAGNYNGGLENFPRLHEQWSGKTLTYRGSFVSLGKPLHVNGAWVYGNPQYTAPVRDYNYDTSFNNAANLPPLSPYFTYLKQEMFDRTYSH